MDIEVYLFERPFFNKPYIFITFVMDNKPPYPSDFSYVRPHGTYYEGLVARGKHVKNTVVVHYPRTYVENYPVKGENSSISMFTIHNILSLIILAPVLSVTKYYNNHDGTARRLISL